MTTRVEIAKHLDVSLKTLSRLINDGVIAAKPGAGVDIDLARINYINHLRKGRTTKGVGGDYSEERTRLTRAQADKAGISVDLQPEQIRELFYADGINHGNLHSVNIS